MICQSFSSVVRLVVSGLLSLTLSACTAQHTREVSQAALRNVGLSSSVVIQRTAIWSLPHNTQVYLEPVVIVGAQHEEYPRLRNHLDRLLETIAGEWFPGGDLETTLRTPAVRVHVGLVAAHDQLSSAHELSQDRDLLEKPTGRDRLSLVMRVYDARSGELLDALSGEATSGWQWREHRVEGLVEPTLHSMFAHLKGVSVTPQ